MRFSSPYGNFAVVETEKKIQFILAPYGEIYKNKSGAQFVKKLPKSLDNLEVECYNVLKFEYHKNDYDEEGRMKRLQRVVGRCETMAR